jgi:hypothetical protein
LTVETLGKTCGLARCRLIQPAIESIRFQQFKRLHSHISVKILLAG